MEKTKRDEKMAHSACDTYIEGSGFCPQSAITADNGSMVDKS
jgi:hypothetical protein